MKQPTLLNDGASKVKKFTSFLMIFSITTLIAILILLVIVFTQHQKILLLEGKVKNDSISIQSYKGFINPNQ